MGDEVRFLLGRLVERSEHMSAVVGRIEYRQIGIIGEMHRMGERVSRLEQQGPVPPAERWIKRALAIVAPAGTLWATGSAEKALEILRLFLH